MTALNLTVIVCTHNPRDDFFDETLSSIRAQTPLGGGREWELLVIDNKSLDPLTTRIDLSWHPHARIVREDRIGLTYARIRSFQEARGDILVYVDDDNVLSPEYLGVVVGAFDAEPKVGAVGGRVFPRYEVLPPPWFPELGISLACRDLGDAPIFADWRGLTAASRTYPECAPIGAGMGIRRSAYASYVESAMRDAVRIGLGRHGVDLSSGEDNDMIMTVLEQGWSVAYWPELRLEHLIPKSRLDSGYLARYAYCSSRTWVQTLNVHGIRPWSSISGWTAPIRKLRAFLRERAWAGPANHIRWCGACGTIDGRALIE
jgi:glycosyltransferase involved in cell wall biosynthesis